jgi:hypothetical protein
MKTTQPSCEILDSTIGRYVVPQRGHL